MDKDMEVRLQVLKDAGVKKPIIDSIANLLDTVRGCRDALPDEVVDPAVSRVKTAINTLYGYGSYFHDCNLMLGINTRERVNSALDEAWVIMRDEIYGNPDKYKYTDYFGPHGKIWKAQLDLLLKMTEDMKDTLTQCGCKQKELPGV